MSTRAYWPLLIAIGLLCLGGTAAAQDTPSQPWLHVQISGDDDDRHDDDGDHRGNGRHDDDGDHQGGNGDDRHDHGENDHNDDDGDHRGGEGDGGEGDDRHDDDGDDFGRNGEGDEGDDHDGDDRGRNGEGDEGDGHDDGHEEADFSVNLNLPLSVVEPLFRLAAPLIASAGRVALPGHDAPLDMEAMHSLWRAIENVGDTEFLTVESEDETVRIARTGDQIHVQMEECDEEGRETADIRLPIVILDALFSGDSNSLNVSAAVDRLSELRGDIVHATGDDYQVRVWVDERPSQ